MCVLSMVMDYYGDKWAEWRQRPAPPAAPAPTITPEEVEEFRRLLERAREYDRKHNQPDCELEEKRQRVKELARELGVEINFL